MLNMMENNENPNEESTLLGKYRRRNTDSVSTIASESLLAETDMSHLRFRWKWHKIRFYLVELMVLILVFAYNLSGMYICILYVLVCTYIRLPRKSGNVLL